MKVDKIIPDPLICPLCGRPNLCVNSGAMDVTTSCWCHDPALVFPKALLAQIPPGKRGKACICKACVLKFQNQNAGL